MNGCEVNVTRLSMHWSHSSSVINNHFTCINFIYLYMYINWNIWVLMMFLFLFFFFSSSYLSLLLSILSNNVVWRMNCICKGGGPYVSGTSVALIRVSRQYLPHVCFIFVSCIYCICCQINVFEFEFISCHSISGRAMPRPSSSRRGRHRQLCAAVWPGVPPCGIQTSPPDAAALQRVYQTGQVVTATSHADQHLHGCVMCTQGTLLWDTCQQHRKSFWREFSEIFFILLHVMKVFVAQREFYNVAVIYHNRICFFTVML